MEFRQIPEVDFKISTTGITIICSRFYTPRFVQFDIKGKCENCKADSAELDFLVTIDGITIYCNRMRQPIFVPFDYKYVSLPQYCLFRVKTRGKVFNIEHPQREQFHPKQELLTDAINMVCKETKSQKTEEHSNNDSKVEENVDKTNL